MGGKSVRHSEREDDGDETTDDEPPHDGLRGDAFSASRFPPSRPPSAAAWVMFRRIGDSVVWDLMPRWARLSHLKNAGSAEKIAATRDGKEHALPAFAGETDHRSPQSFSKRE